MIELVRHLVVVCAMGLGLAAPAWADEQLHGQVIGVVGGDVITLVDARQRERQLRQAFIDAPMGSVATGSALFHRHPGRSGSRRT